MPDSTALDALHGWTILDPGPLSSRVAETQVWTGSELWIWGGYTPESGEALDDGAAYDPATRTWRTLPTSENVASGSGDGVWTGSELVVVNDQVVSAFDPAMGRWHLLFYTEFGGDSVARVILDGSHLLVFTSSDQTGAVSLWRTDLSTGEWTSMRPDLDANAADWLWTGSQFIDPSGYDEDTGGVMLSIYDVHTGELTTSIGPSLDTNTDTFGALGPQGQVFVWADQYYNPDDTDMAIPTDHGLAFDPATGTWTEIAGIDRSWFECSIESAIAGHLVFVEACGDRLWLNPDNGTSTYIAWTEPLEGVDTYPAATPIWTGSELLFWGEPFCFACDEAQPPRFASLAPPSKP